MADTEPVLAGTFDAFADARGVELDETWAFSVAWRLMMDDVAADQVRSGLEAALEVVRQSGESPEDLFGAPREYAERLRQEWLEDGTLVLADPTPTWPEALRLGLGLSAAYAVGLACIQLVRDGLAGLDDPSLLRTVAIAVITGVGGSLGMALWSRRHRRKPPVDAPVDLRWSLEVTEILRTRYSLPGPRVRGIVAEANAHAAESGRTVVEEFGSPVTYAARFAPDRARRSRFTAATCALIAVSSSVLVVDGSWIVLVPALWFGWEALTEHRRGRQDPAQSGR